MLRVDGMNCEMCVRSVVRALDAIPGVTRASATLDGRSATVEHEAGIPRNEALIEALELQGYDARVTTG